MIESDGNWTSGSIQWTLEADVGKGLTLYKTLFPVMVKNEGNQGADQGHSGAFSYSYDSDTGIAKITIYDRYRFRSATVNWYILQY